MRMRMRDRRLHLARGQGSNLPVPDAAVARGNRSDRHFDHIILAKWRTGADGLHDAAFGILKACGEKGFTPSILLSSGQVETHKELVSKEMGVSFLIEKIAAKSKRIITRPLAEPIYLEFGLAWRKDKYLSRAAQTFINFVLEKKPTF